jgi:Rod binding domain-containing protein
MRIESNPAFVSLDAEAVHAMRRRLLASTVAGTDGGPGVDRARELDGGRRLDAAPGAAPAAAFDLEKPSDPALVHSRRREIHDDANKAAQPTAEELDKAASTARRLEGVLLTSLISRMREASNVQFFGDTPGVQVFEGMFDEMMGDALAAKRGIGLYKEIERSIIGARADGDATLLTRRGMTMTSPDFPAFVRGLESELAAQRAVAAHLDAALAAAARRDLDALESSLRSLDAETRRLALVASERGRAATRFGGARRSPSLAEISRLPGAPVAALTRLRAELAAAVDAAASRARRLQAVVRELGEVYGCALGVLLRPAGAESPAPEGHGALVNTEA